MHSSILQAIGLTSNEAKIYETLLDRGTCSINELSAESNVHRRNVYDSLEKLIHRGLVAQEYVSGVRHLTAIHPNRLRDILREKEQQLDSILPEMEKKFHSKVKPDQAVMYHGIEGFKSYLHDILEENQPVYFIGAKGFWLDERLKYFLPKFDQQRIKQGIQFKHIFDYEVKSLAPDILNLKLNEYKFFPKEYSSQIAVDIFGDHVVTFYGVSPGKLPLEPVQYTVVSKTIADGYRKYFDFLWKNLGPAKK